MHTRLVVEKFGADGGAREELIVGLVAVVLTLVATAAIVIDIDYWGATAAGSVLAVWCLGVVVIITRRLLIDMRELGDRDLRLVGACAPLEGLIFR